MDQVANLNVWSDPELPASYLECKVHCVQAPMTYEECLANNTRRLGAEPFYASIGRESPENKCLDTVVMLQTFLGLGIVVGTLGFSCLVVNKSKQCLISPQYLLQISILGIGQLSSHENLAAYCPVICSVKGEQVSTRPLFVSGW